MTPLARLLAAVEAGPLWDIDDPFSVPSKDVSDLIRASFAHEDGWSDFCEAYASKDVTAAISLCGAMLPGVRMEIIGPYDDGLWLVNLPDQDSVINTNPARALLIALLRAMVAREGGE